MPAKAVKTELLEANVNLAKEIKENLEKFRKEIGDGDIEDIYDPKYQKLVEDLCDMFDNEYCDLSKSTLRKHTENIYFYLYDFGWKRQGLFFPDMLNFGAQLDFFFGDWYVSHCSWSTPSSTKSNIAALKKLMKMLVKYGLETKENQKEFKKTIDENLEHWIHLVKVYNDPDSDYSDYMTSLLGFDPSDDF